MKKLVLNIVFILLGLQTVQAQYTYFNQISGDIGDLSSESTTNIEALDNGYVVWGGGVNDGVNSKYIRKFDFNGNLSDEDVLTFENEFFYAGITNSMQ